MARLFNLSLEETIAEAEGVAVRAPQEEIDAIENSETAAETEAEIENSSAEVSEAMEEAEALQEQVNVNEEILEQTKSEEGEPTEVAPAEDGSAVTEEQVVEAQESLKYAIASFGGRAGYVNQVRVSTESAKYMSRRQRLKVANETAKDFIKKLIETAKKIIKQIRLKITGWVKSIQFKLGNYGKAVEDLISKLKGANDSDIDLQKVEDNLTKIGTYEVIAAMAEGRVYGFDSGTKRSDASAVKAAADKAISGEFSINDTVFKKEIDVTFSGFKAVEGGKVVGATGKSALIIGEKGFEKKPLVFDKLPNATLTPNFLKEVIAESQEVLKAIKEAPVLFKAYQNIQESCGSQLDKVKEGDENAAKKVEVIKSISVTACVFKMNEMVGAIKGYIAICKALLAAKKGEETK